jgi:hypothetical protein
MVFATMYASVSQYPEIGHKYAPLGISIINCVQILGSFGVAIGFTLVANQFGFPSGWLFMGGLALVMMLLISFLQEPFKARL